MTKSSKTDIFPAAEASLNITGARGNATVEPLTLQSIILIEDISNVY